MSLSGSILLRLASSLPGVLALSQSLHCHEDTVAIRKVLMRPYRGIIEGHRAYALVWWRLLSQALA